MRIAETTTHIALASSYLSEYVWFCISIMSDIVTKCDVLYINYYN